MIARAGIEPTVTPTKRRNAETLSNFFIKNPILEPRGFIAPLRRCSR
jgi:hypothetical protein